MVMIRSSPPSGSTSPPLISPPSPSSSIAIIIVTVNTSWTKTTGDQRTHLWRRATRLNERYYVYTRVMVSSQTKRVWLSVFDAVTMMLMSTITAVNIKERIKPLSLHQFCAHHEDSYVYRFGIIWICVVADINLMLNFKLEKNRRNSTVVTTFSKYSILSNYVTKIITFAFIYKRICNKVLLIYLY